MSARNQMAYLLFFVAQLQALLLLELLAGQPLGSLRIWHWPFVNAFFALVASHVAEERPSRTAAAGDAVPAGGLCAWPAGLWRLRLAALFTFGLSPFWSWRFGPGRLAAQWGAFSQLYVNAVICAALLACFWLYCEFAYALKKSWEAMDEAHGRRSTFHVAGIGFCICICATFGCYFMMLIDQLWGMKDIPWRGRLPVLLDVAMMTEGEVLPRWARQLQVAQLLLLLSTLLVPFRLHRKATAYAAAPSTASSTVPVDTSSCGEELAASASQIVTAEEERS